MAQDNTAKKETTNNAQQTTWVDLPTVLPGQVGYRSVDILAAHSRKLLGESNKYTNLAHNVATPEDMRADCMKAANFLLFYSKACETLSQYDPKTGTKEISAKIIEIHKRMEADMKERTAIAQKAGKLATDDMGYVTAMFVWSMLENQWQWLLHPDKFAKGAKGSQGQAVDLSQAPKF